VRVTKWNSLKPNRTVNDLVSEYQPYQDATADEEDVSGDFDEDDAE
jgi:hypothetical protein